jgi:hypothetical protein
MSEKPGARFTFENHQRILTHYSNASLQVIQYLLSINLAGFGGLYALRNGSERQPWTLALSAGMVASIILLFLVWMRERTLGRQSIAFLEKEFHFLYGRDSQVHFPGVNGWQGVTGVVWACIMSVCFLIWTRILLDHLHHVSRMCLCW